MWQHMTSLYTYLIIKFLPGHHMLYHHIIGITPKLMKIRHCCWVSLESSQRVHFNEIMEKKFPP
ncbi:hypothetical protein O3M35_009293 [Rhynocoris fuscipes]|uniref:Uncharacterized protein n=1 Tax=Rhynocoris fuscipes TaxID=488301 RepID=A0AAW1DA02_9HEMI